MGSINIRVGRWAYAVPGEAIFAVIFLALCVWNVIAKQSIGAASCGYLTGYFMTTACRNAKAQKKPEK